MQPMSKKYKFNEIEQKWQKNWEEMGIYHFDWNDITKPVFSIDTPPFSFAGSLNQTALLDEAPEVLLMRSKTGNGFDGALQLQQRECLGNELEGNRTIAQFSANTTQSRCQDTAMVERHRATESFGRG